MKTEKITVKGMHCMGCENMVKDSVMELPGIKDVKASFKKESVEVKFDESKTGIAEIKKAIQDAGYKPE